MTDAVVRLAVRISRDLAYFVIDGETDVLILMVRPFGRRGHGLWLRSVTRPTPFLTPPW